MFKPGVDAHDPLVRFQVEVRKSYLAVLRALQEAGGVSSNKELFNNAIALLQWAVTQKQRGYSIAAVTEEGAVKRELVLPFLEEAAQQPLFRLVSTEEGTADESTPVVAPSPALSSSSKRRAVSLAKRNSA